MSRGRRIIENTFAILGSRWRVLWSKIDVSELTARKITCAAVVLHNFLNKENKDNNNVEVQYPSDYVDQYNENGDLIFGTWRENCAHNVQNMETANEASTDLKILRNILASYFSLPSGQVPWQRDIINQTH